MELCFRFNRVELGKIPPMIEGVKTYVIDKDTVILDLDVVYEGDLRYLGRWITVNLIQ